MKKLLVFPTWVTVRLMSPLMPKTHIWHGRKFTLKDWANGGAELLRAFSAMFWVFGLCALGLFIQILILLQK